MNAANILASLRGKSSQWSQSHRFVKESDTSNPKDGHEGLQLEGVKGPEGKAHMIQQCPD